HFIRALSNILITNNVPADNADLIGQKIEIPFDNEMLLSLYLFKEGLKDDVNEYVKHFGMELVSTGIVLMNNLQQIYEQINKRLRSLYSDYEEDFIRKSVQNLQKGDKVDAIEDKIYRLELAYEALHGYTPNTVFLGKKQIKSLSENLNVSIKEEGERNLKEKGVYGVFKGLEVVEVQREDFMKIGLNI